jgi:putative oxidoreductase
MTENVKDPLLPTATIHRDQPGSALRQIEHVGSSGIYPMSGPHPAGPAELRGQGELAHPEERRRTPLLRGRQSGTIPLLLGRAIFGGYFLYSGIGHFLNRRMMTEYARAKGVPLPAAAVVSTGLMLVAGGSSLIAGVKPKAGASLISTFLLGVSPQMHAFWKEQDQQARMQEMINFTKNMALVGGAMFAAAHPEPWPVAAAR